MGIWNIISILKFIVDIIKRLMEYSDERKEEAIRNTINSDPVSSFNTMFGGMQQNKTDQGSKN